MAARVTLKIEGIECPNCVMRLESMEDHLAGIRRAEASYHKGQMVVEYDEVQITVEQIKAEIRRLGFEVVPLV
jgi:copper chaperone CopZ